MFYEKIKNLKKDPVAFRGNPSIVEITRMPVKTRDEKIEVAIKLIGYINGLKYQGSKRELKLQNKFNEKVYTQSLADSVTYHRKPEIVVGTLFKSLLILVQDINLSMSDDCKVEILEECLASEPDEFGVRNFSSFFEDKLTDTERRKLNNKGGEVTGRSELDRKAMAFLVELENGKEYAITDRVSFLKIKNSDCLHILSNRDLDLDLQTILDNIDKVDGRKKRHVIQALLTASLFTQTYDKYPLLVDAITLIKEKLKREA